MSVFIIAREEVGFQAKLRVELRSRGQRAEDPSLIPFDAARGERSRAK